MKRTVGRELGEGNCGKGTGGGSELKKGTLGEEKGIG